MASLRNGYPTPDGPSEPVAADVEAFVDDSAPGCLSAESGSASSTRVEATSYSGPLPSPSDFAAFNRETNRGQWFAFVLAIVTVTAGGLTAYGGAQWTGSVIGTGGLIGLITAFIVGCRKPPE